MCLLRKNDSMRTSRNLIRKPVFHAIAYLCTLSLAPSTATKRINKGKAGWRKSLVLTRCDFPFADYFSYKSESSFMTAHVVRASLSGGIIDTIYTAYERLQVTIVAKGQNYASEAMLISPYAASEQRQHEHRPRRYFTKRKDLHLLTTFEHCDFCWQEWIAYTI